MTLPPVLLWLRTDLRLADNPALAAAIAAAGRGGAVIPVFIWAPDEEAPFAPGAASRVWLHESLARLGEALRAKGSRLVLRAGPTAATLRALVAETSARTVLWNRRYEPAVAARDAHVRQMLQALGVRTPDEGTLAPAALLREPEALRTASGRPFQVFAAFWRAFLAAPPPPPPAPAPRALPAPRRWPRSLPLAALGLRPAVPWDRGIRAAWTPGEAGARARLRRFVTRGLGDYGARRDRPDLDATSRLSPHLHFGEVGPRQVWHAACEAADAAGIDPAPFLRELAWREFAHHVLHAFPHTATAPMRPEFARFPWARNPAALRAWQRGRTGYPIVDAGMRELWATGYLPNRVRMIVASFLTKHLLLPWQAGAAWFWDTLVDADLADNTLNWQWVAGSGVDAAPYFRIFNPALQGRKLDPDGAYVRRWIPDLKGGYPRPIVEHTFARARALAAFAQMRRR